MKSSNVFKILLYKMKHLRKFLNYFQKMSANRTLKRVSDEIFESSSSDSWSDSSEWYEDNVRPKKKQISALVSESSEDEEECSTVPPTRTIVTSCHTATAKECDVESKTCNKIESSDVQQLENSLDELIKKHKEKLKEVRRQEKASNSELLNCVNLMLNGEELFVDNNDVRLDPSFQFSGENLLELQAGPEPSKFGLVLARKMFGDNSECELQNKMLGPGRRNTEQRERVDKQKEDVFDSKSPQSYFVHSCRFFH